MEFVRKLPIPMEIKEKFPVSAKMQEIFEKRAVTIKNIFEGTDERLILVIGPCSADAKEPVLEYISRLAQVQEQVKDKIFIIPRIYTNKPRTTGEGYKGMLHQPNPEGLPDIYHGILAIRHLHTRALTETGLSTADEMLYPSNHRYLSDLLSYVAVGARSSEDQEHRLVSSGIDVPVGLKNPTSGDLSVMMNSITAAQHGHSFIYRGWAVETKGNEMAHAILRGFVDKHGKSIPNYHYEDLANLHELYAKSDLKNPALILDANHANSGKRFAEQPRICKEVLHSCRHNPDIRRMVKGFMIESYLVDGCQKIGEGVFGQSITDPCIGWEKTVQLVMDIADLV